jgi:polysaccharide deacetylase 2 family uncharacterized protein YibQ
MGGGVLNGVILGLVVSGVVLAALSLSTSLPDRPGAPPPAGTGQEATAPVAPDAAEADADPLATPAGAETSPEAATTAPDPTRAAETTAEPSNVPAEDRPVDLRVPEPNTPAPGLAPRPSVTGAETDAITLGAPAAPDQAPGLPRIETQPSPASPIGPSAAPARDSAPGFSAPSAAAPSGEIAITPDSPAQAPPATAPSPRFSAATDASAGGAPPRRLQPPQGLDRLATVDTVPPAPFATAPGAVDPLMPAPAPDVAGADPAGGMAMDPDRAAVPSLARRLPQVTAPEGAPVPAVPEVASGLPQAGVPMAPEAGVAPGSAPDAVAALEDAPEPAPPNALRDNAAPFEAPEGSALLAIVLIDEPDSALDPTVLNSVSFPVSFAIDPMRPDAAARAAALRELGREVVILGAGTIPPGAAPSDVEVALAVARETMPQAVALMDDPASRIQADRPVLDATVAALADSGHGLIAFPRGLNAAEQSARRAEVPMATVFRLLDDQDQSAALITRGLGRAAVAAGQEGAVVVVGHTRPDTVTALVSWASSGRAEGVAIAPVSAVLLRAGE